MTAHNTMEARRADLAKSIAKLSGWLDRMVKSAARSRARGDDPRYTAELDEFVAELRRDIADCHAKLAGFEEEPPTPALPSLRVRQFADSWYVLDPRLNAVISPGFDQRADALDHLDKITPTPPHVEAVERMAAVMAAERAAGGGA